MHQILTLTVMCLFVVLAVEQIWGAFRVLLRFNLLIDFHPHENSFPKILSTVESSRILYRFRQLRLEILIVSGENLQGWWKHDCRLFRSHLA